MQPHNFLRENERNQRLTVSHAIDVLVHEANFADSDFAEIQVGCLTLPSQKQVGLVNVFFGNSSLDQTSIVSLATSTAFVARRHGEADLRRFDISELNGARVDNDGIVRLADGATLRAVEVIPAKLPLEPSNVDWRIVHHVISIIRAEDRCYSSLREHARPRCSDVCQEWIPDVSRIDCGKLAGLTRPSLKALAQEIGRKDPTLKKLSHTKIAGALRSFGMRIPTRSTRAAMTAVLP